MGNPRKVHVGMKIMDYHRFYKRNGGIVNKTLFPKIFTDYCAALKAELLDTREVKLPRAFGLIRIIKFLPKLEMGEDGYLINHLPVNPKATHELWQRDPEAKEKRVLVRYRNTHADGYTFMIHWYRGNTKSIGIFTFKSNRILKRELSRKIINENYDAYIK